MQTVWPIVVQHQSTWVGVTARLDAEEVLHLALVPVRGGHDACDRRELWTCRIDLCLDRDQRAGREGEHVIQTEASAALAFVGARHNDEPRPPLLDERRARVG